MHYFFDESGNWQYPLKEKNRLLIGGLLVKNQAVRKDMGEELRIFKVRNGQNEIHAADIKDESLREELYRIIDRYLQLEEVEALVHILKPRKLLSSTVKDADELYIDIASKLISDISFGDDKLDIEYDMKFHYAYPQNIIENFKSNRAMEFVNMEKNFTLSPDGYLKEKKRVLKNISRSLGKSNYKLQEVYDIISNDQDSKHLEVLHKYIWTEFRLKIEKSSFLKDKFKDKIEEHAKQKCKEYALPYEPTKSKIRYKHKHYQTAGVQVVDVICNLVWRNGHKPPNIASNTIKSLYDNIVIKDISDEI